MPANALIGSPPRMRGRGLCFPALCKLLGITPAYAGKSWRGQLCPWAFQDHPRVCGEKLFPFAFRRILGGSPPRVRGKGGIIRYNNFVHRITPACAGKSERFWSRKDTLEDHPRVCGEKRLEIISMHLVKGSPPRVRGKAASADVGFRNLGITPACAGKSVCTLDIAGFPEDHPRVCGEKTVRKEEARRNPGSPPRVRGKVHRFSLSCPAHGITPACAGKSNVPALVQVHDQDHPRVCGEKKKMNARKDKHMGSPPRVRGKDRL